MAKKDRKDIPVFNCFMWDFNHDRMEKCNIFHHLDSEYQFTIDNKDYAETQPLPTNLEEAKEWCKNHLMYQYWSRCEYEWIAHGWPVQKNEEKIDVYREAMLNIDIIAKMFMEYYIEIPTMTDTLVGTRVAKSETVAGDVYMYDSVNNVNFWMRPSIFTDDIGNEKYTSDRYQAIAVVAIPASHNVYGNGDVGMVSLNYMRYDTPETGGDAQGIRWGGYGTDLSGLTNLTQVPVYSGTASTSLIVNDYGYSPSDNFTAYSLTNILSDEGSKYNLSTNLVPSPYAQDGKGRNELYFATANCLSDFDGKGNTDVMIAATEVDWSSIAITNSYDAGNYPAAYCCRRYHWGNTKAGDWYLPAAGEGGYLMARLKRINQAITDIKKLNSTVVAVNTNNTHWLSTESSNNLSRSLTTEYGGQYTSNKNNYYSVRGWLRA